MTQTDTASISARLLSIDGQSDNKAVDVEVDVVDFNDDQDPTVAINVDDFRQYTFLLPANNAERLGLYLIQAAAVSREVEPGGVDALLPEDITNRLLVMYPNSVDKLREAIGRTYRATGLHSSDEDLDD